MSKTYRVEYLAGVLSEHVVEADSAEAASRRAYGEIYENLRPAAEDTDFAISIVYVKEAEEEDEEEER